MTATAGLVASAPSKRLGCATALYRSRSGAASAAAADLGINGRVNGFQFWGLIKAGRPITNPGEYLRKIAGRYEEQVALLLKQEVSSAGRHEVRRELIAYAAHLTELLASSAST